MTKEEKKEYDRQRYLLNKETIKEQTKQYQKNNKEKTKQKTRRYYKNNTEKVKLQNKKYYSENKTTLNEKRKTYLETNDVKIKAQQKEYRKLNKEKLKNKLNLYRKERIASDPLYRLTSNIRGLIKNSIKQKNFKKNSKTIEILGCSFNEFRLHIESQFESWMNWDNHGAYNLDGERTWNIDHIIPMASAQTEEDVVRLNHYTNLRPLCSKENNEKGKKERA